MGIMKVHFGVSEKVRIMCQHVLEKIRFLFRHYQNPVGSVMSVLQVRVPCHVPSEEDGLESTVPTGAENVGCRGIAAQ